MVANPSRDTFLKFPGTVHRKEQPKMIKEYKTKNGEKRYLFKAYLGTDPFTGKKKYTTRRNFKTKKEASTALARLKVEVEDNGIRKLQKATFKEIYDLFMVEHKNTVKPGTYATTKRYADLHILPKIAKTPINNLTVTNCQKLVNDWASYFNSAKYPRGIVIQVLDYAIKLEVLQTNNMRKVKLPKPKEKILEVNSFYDSKELKLFFDCLEDYNNPKFSAFFRLLAFTGMRKGEAVGLMWKDINFNDLSVNINKGVALDTEGNPYLSTPKTKSSKRLLSIDSKTSDALKTWKQVQAKELLRLGYNALDPNQLVFTHQDNKMYRPSYLNDWLNLIIKKYELKPITIHGFRHSHCSLLFEMGTPIQVVQERLGHSNIKTTMDIYTHVTEKQRDQVADNFAKYVNF